MEKPSGEFFKTLGQYIYMYVDPSTGFPSFLPNTHDYIGKANGDDRCWTHVADKGLNPDDIWIVARNLERFEGKENYDWQAFLAESLLISLFKPKLNKVSGHYQECFEMTTLSSLFGTYQSDQYDNFESFPEWYVENYDIIRGNVGKLTINGSNFSFSSNAKSGLYMRWDYSWASTDRIRVQIELNNRLNATEFENQKSKVIQFIEMNGFEAEDKTGKGTNAKIVEFSCENMDEVIGIFKQFVK